MRVLIVEEDPLLQGLFAESFDEHGWAAEVCGDLDVALPIAEHGEFEGMVLSLKGAGPGHHLRVARLRRAQREVPVVILAAELGTEARDFLEGLDIRNFLTPPWRMSEIRQLLGDAAKARGDAGDEPADAPRLTQYRALDSGELDALKKMLIGRPDDPHVKWLLGFSYYRGARYRDAAQLFDDLLKTDATNVLALYYLAACRYRLARYEDALVIWKRIHDVDPRGPITKKIDPYITYVEKLLARRPRAGA